MEKRTSWIPSIIIVLGSSLFLGLTLRGTGPTGSGVAAMLQMQSAWSDLPTLHMTGTILEADSGAAERHVKFEFWKVRGGKRRVVFSPIGAGQSTTTVLSPEHAWKWSGAKGMPQELDPGRADLFPLPDPDAPDATFYRHAKRWTAGRTKLVRGITCTEVTGEESGGRFTFDLDKASHLPRRVEIEDSGTKGGRRIVDFETVQFPTAIPDALFQRP